jgi:hypothetical protein
VSEKKEATPRGLFYLLCRRWHTAERPTSVAFSVNKLPHAHNVNEEVLNNDTFFRARGAVFARPKPRTRPTAGALQFVSRRAAGCLAGCSAGSAESTTPLLNRCRAIFYAAARSPPGKIYDLASQRDFNFAKIPARSTFEFMIFCMLFFDHCFLVCRRRQDFIL